MAESCETLTGKLGAIIMDNWVRYTKVIGYMVLDEFYFIRHLDFSHWNSFSGFEKIISMASINRCLWMKVG